MKVIAKIENPDGVVVTITASMTLENWKTLREQVREGKHNQWPTCDLLVAITDAVYNANRGWNNERVL